MPNDLTDLVVVGAHLDGQPLNGELLVLGGRLVGEVRTAAVYRLWALRTSPAKPGLVRVVEGGASVRGEHWRLPPASLGRFVSALVPPMTIGVVELDDGRSLPGFLVEPYALADAVDITAHEGWVSYLDSAASAGRDAARRPSLSSMR